MTIPEARPDYAKLAQDARRFPLWRTSASFQDIARALQSCAADLAAAKSEADNSHYWYEEARRRLGLCERTPAAVGEGRVTAELSSLIEQALGTLREYVKRVGYHEAAGLGSTEHAEECRHCAALAALDSLASLVAEREAELARWLSWSGGEFPDDTVGDVIAANPYGTITLDDGITTWNPQRAAAFFKAEVAERDERIAELEQALAFVREKIEAGDIEAALSRSVSAGHAGEQE